MIEAKFRFSSQILVRLGEELNPSFDQSLLELVKNSYDADARNCTIEIKNASSPGGTLTIEDDGIGMTANDIKEGWLVLGKSSKNSSEITGLGRVPAGSKGLGRLAALRMGTVATVESISNKYTNTSLNLTINWSEFKNATLVDEIPLKIIETEITPKTSGTKITIVNLRSAISDEDMKRLARALVMLADPFADSKLGFKPVLKAPEFKLLEKLVRGRYFSFAFMHLKAELQPDGFASAIVKDSVGKVVFQADHKAISQKNDKTQPYGAPSATFDLYLFNLSKSDFSLKDVKPGEVKAWLGNFGGVHIYQDGIRVAPYGNPGNDWLDLNLRRAQSPEERPSTNNSIGRVQLSSNPWLIQKTDRLGYIENETFSELKQFLRDCTEWLAKSRLAAAENRRIEERTQAITDTEKSRQKIETVLNSSTSDEAVKNAFKEYDQAVTKQAKALRHEIQLYRTLSTAGIIAATFAHESTGNPLKTLRTTISTIENRIKRFVDYPVYVSKFSEQISRIRIAIDSLGVIGNTTLSLVKKNKRGISNVNLHKVIEDILSNYKPLLTEYDISVEFNSDDTRPNIKSSRAAIEAIVANLINNAVYFVRPCLIRTISIEYKVSSEAVLLIIRDSGPGIPEHKLNDIWLPGESSKSEGTGFGLTIVRDTVADLGGTYGVRSKSSLGGAEFHIALPLSEGSA